MFTIVTVTLITVANVLDKLNVYIYSGKLLSLEQSYPPKGEQQALDDGLFGISASSVASVSAKAPLSSPCNSALHFVDIESARSESRPDLICVHCYCERVSASPRR
nr:MAG TPA: hypothetical protein [Caudoviricetes sp.]